jgi:hypothetical protein
MAHFSLPDIQMRILKEIAGAQSAGVERIAAQDLADTLRIRYRTCLVHMRSLKSKKLVTCDDNSAWSLSRNGEKCLAIAASVSEKLIKEKIVHEREHLGITTTKDTLTVTGTSAPTAITTDTGTSLGLALRMPSVEFNIDSKDTRTIEFKTMCNKKRLGTTKGIEYV